MEGEGAIGFAQSSPPFLLATSAKVIAAKPRRCWVGQEPRVKMFKYLLLLPAILFFVGLTLFPLIYTVRMSLGQQFAGQGYLFVGSRNYAEMLRDSTFWEATKNTLLLVLMVVPIEYLLGLLVALAVSPIRRGKTTLRVLNFLPFLLSPVVAAFMWKMMFDSAYGVVDDMLARIGLSPIPWTTSTRYSLFAVAIADIWQWTPFMFLILLSGLASIPQRPLEAARVDGASSWRIFKDHVFPLLSPASFAAIFLRLIFAFQIFEIPFITTLGGPGASSTTLTLYAYSRGLLSFNLGYGAAISVFLLVLVIVITMAFLLFGEWIRRRMGVS